MTNFRCRSKKIRCDGIRPCCSQCSTVGFECKTSDKLSRRAFPRGYTESLEERVRSLEAEVRDLKELLDEKDEKIDMLSRLHSQSTAPTFYPSPRRPSTSPSALSPGQSQSLPSKEELFQIQQSPYLDGTGDMSYFSGASSSKAFLGMKVPPLPIFSPKLTPAMQHHSTKRCKRVGDAYPISTWGSFSRQPHILIRMIHCPIPLPGRPLHGWSLTG